MKINSVFLTFPIFETKLKITSQYEKFVKSRKLNQFELHSNNYEKENEELTLKTEYLLNDFLIAVCKHLASKNKTLFIYSTPFNDSFSNFFCNSLLLTNSSKHSFRL